MRKINLFYFVTAIVFGLALTISSCTKEGPTGPEGPAGADGATGENGMDGTDGTDGVDGNAVCMECHTLGNKAAVESQYAMSTHFNSNLMYTGQTVYQYAGEGPGRTSCTGCHSEQGFVAWQYTGNLTYPDTNGVQSAMPVGCVTCHDMHSTFDFENDGIDYAIREMGPVELIMFDDATTIDFGNTSNLCANCHQPRTAGPVDDGNGSFTISNPHYGPHHGPHATILEGIGGYETDGVLAYPAPQSSTHRTGSSCVDCHGHEFSNGNGGHSLHPGIEGCTSCHESATDFDINGVQTEIAGYINDLKAKLVAASIINEEGDLLNDDGDVLDYGQSLTIPVDQAGAYYNWATMVDDRSDGIHNPAYIKALLVNSIAVF